MSVAYLDTHVVVWLYAGMVEKFTAKSQHVLESAALRVSPMVLLELQYLQEKGVIAVAPDTIFAELAQTIGLSVCTLPFTLVSREALALSWTRDPFDRLIVAQAGIHQEPLVSKDQHIHQHYPQAIW